MNYYPHHIGDYMRDTAHLTMLEDCAYRRLMDVYYAREKPLPADEKAVWRLVRAHSKKERQAVSTVLREFFELCEDDCWHQSRCDAVLSKAREEAEETQAGHDHKNERQQRHRQRRKEMFEALRQYGVTPAFDTKTSELETLLLRHRDAPVTSPETDLRRNGDALETAIHKPITNNQNQIDDTAATPPPVTRGREETPPPVTSAVTTVTDARAISLPASTGKPPDDAPEIPDAASSRAVQIAVLLRRNGSDFRTAANDRNIIAWAEQGVSDTQILTALETAKQRRIQTGSQQPIGTAYLAPIVAQACNPQVQRSPPMYGRYAEDARQMAELVAQANATLAGLSTRELDMGVLHANFES